MPAARLVPGLPALYAAIGGLVERGEWTTYGDISVVVHGSRRYARHVGRAAATYEPFANAQRVLGSGGLVAAGWRDAHGDGPAACRRRLEREGVDFVGGRADPRRGITWEDLIARADAAGLPRAAVISFT